MRKALPENVQQCGFLMYVGYEIEIYVTECGIFFYQIYGTHPFNGEVLIHEVPPSVQTDEQAKEDAKNWIHAWKKQGYQQAYKNLLQNEQHESEVARRLHEQKIINQRTGLPY